MVRGKLWLVLVILVLLGPAIVACSPASESTPALPTPESTPAPPASVELEEPALTGTLKSVCQSAQSSVRGNFDIAGLGLGEKAVNFILRDTYGSETRLSQLLAEKPVMMVFGSFT